MTRSQYYNQVTVPESTQRFAQTVENPCVLQVIMKTLSKEDLLALKLVSKDSRFNEIINKELKQKKKEKAIARKLKNYLLHIECSYTLEEKIHIVDKMFRFLCTNKWFVDKTDAFKKVVHKQLFKIMLEHPKCQQDFVKYAQKLYDLKPPKKVYNPKTQKFEFGMFNMEHKFVLLESW